MIEFKIKYMNLTLSPLSHEWVNGNEKYVNFILNFVIIR